MGKGKGAIARRRAWRNRGFEKLGNRSLSDIEKPHRSNVLRRLLGMKEMKWK